MLKTAKASGLSDVSVPEVHCIHMENVTIKAIVCTLVKKNNEKTLKGRIIRLKKYSFKLKL